LCSAIVFFDAGHNTTDWRVVRSFARPLSRKEVLSMRFLLLLRVAYLCATAAVESGVVTLTAATFDDAVRSHAKVKLKTRNVSIYSAY
jgi:hypothetical protein